MEQRTDPVINPDGVETADRSRACSHIVTPSGVASVSQWAPTELIAAMIERSVRPVQVIRTGDEQ